MSHPLRTQDRLPSGDCLAARRKLGLAPAELADSVKLPPAELNDARRHVKHCAECQSVLRRRDQFDEYVGAICRDVPVPEGLANRILAALDRGAGDPTTEPEPLPTSTVAAEVASPASARAIARPRRRHVFWLSAAAACVVLVLGGVWHVAFRPTIDLDQLVAAGIGPEAAQLPLFAEGTAPPPLPSTLNGRMAFSAPHQLAAGRAAVYLFELPASRSGSAIRGRLLAVPAAKLIRRPEATAFLGGPADYRVTAYCSCAWVEGDVAYVCLVEGGEDLLHRLKARTVAT